MLRVELHFDEYSMPCRRSAGRPVQCLAVSSPALAGGLQALPRGSYQIMRAAADAYARSQGAGDDDDKNKGSSETPSPAPITPSPAPTTPSSSPPKEQSSGASTSDVRHLVAHLSCV